jgi:hypothetical protein
MTERGLHAGYELYRIHHHGNPVRAVEEARGIFIGGGKTFRLLTDWYRFGLVDVTRDRVRHGLPYLRLSAGTYVAKPQAVATIRERGRELGQSHLRRALATDGMGGCTWPGVSCSAALVPSKSAQSGPGTRRLFLFGLPIRNMRSAGLMVTSKAPGNFPTTWPQLLTS